MKMKTNNYDYVDLGLPSGTLWATCNVGANKPYEYGKYFAWGETDGYYGDEDHNFYWSNYKYGNAKGTEMTKYNTSDEYGIVDDRLVLKLDDDAVHVNMGGDWKMPTAEQMEELFIKTNHEWVDDYQGTGINGRVFTSKTNGNTMFIPASGYRFSTSNFLHSDYASLWSSTLDANYPLDSILGNFHSCDFGKARNYRYYGYCVRGVLNKTDNIKSDE